MLIKTKGKAIELLNRALPYPQQIKNIDLDKESVIYFSWRDGQYKLSLEFCTIEEVDGPFLRVSDSAILMTRLIKSQFGIVM